MKIAIIIFYYSICQEKRWRKTETVFGKRENCIKNLKKRNLNIKKKMELRKI